MKKLKFSALAVALIASSSSFVFADTIQLGSFATGAFSFGNANTAMNYAGYRATLTMPAVGVGGTFTLKPSSVWTAPAANSTWIGFASTAGPVGTANPALGYYTFTTNFTATAGSYAGTLNIMADDSASILLNGSVIVPFASLGGDTHCADSGITCRGMDAIALSGLTLLGGSNVNTLTFIVRQGGSLATLDPSGLDFNATLNSPSSGAVPEPSTLMLLATGLVGAATTAMRRRIGL